MSAGFRPVLTDIAETWARCRRWILPALADCQGTYSEDDIVRGLFDGRYFIVAGDRCAGIAHIDRFPRLTVLHVFLAGGDLAELKQMEAAIARQAKAAGIGRIEISGRRGWLRALPGYRELCTTVIKDL
ncbi:MAG: hypothetical protein SFV21_17735 [Rhodospirillaceae bacterium]|nr:hypothetical protein [Rhodospirillaceae bacterium]